ncbi:Methyltransferase-like protein [Lachnellula suecica]|uniref:Methyltransferase-like protein n=1 Tax=Lachnellula suecica TaxID=602035 RepID=A0A8T9CGG9_9HELO|nr:Methyltransferase-like protein [Lachnellula suecica]
MASCILYQDDESSVTLLDIPRSIELIQGDSTKKIISSRPLEQPYPSVEPKTAKARAKIGEVPLEDLLLQKHLQLALDGLKETYHGVWCLPRVTAEAGIEKSRRKRKKEEISTDPNPQEESQTSKLDSTTSDVANVPQSPDSEDHWLFHNPNSESIYTPNDSLRPSARVPPCSTALQGDIAATLETFNISAPKLNLMTMDPPWPNRSARRKNAYATSYSTTDIQRLLSSIPVKDHLAEDGLVAVWVTNKVAFRDLLLEDGGLFDEWGIQLLEEWVWVKVTANGDMICAVDSSWKKPYEILLVGRKKGENTKPEQVKRKVIVAVPDLHSRKPNLKVLFEKMMGMEEYEGLEVFARNLTAGWWAWGNEVFKFQTDEHWIDETSP